jgi:hypothetical protein
MRVTVVPPFQGLPLVMRGNPGRCPGLNCCAPLALKDRGDGVARTSAFPDGDWGRGDISPLQGLSLFKRTNPGRCPGLFYAALSGLKACEFWAWEACGGGAVNLLFTRGNPGRCPGLPCCAPLALKDRGNGVARTSAFPDGDWGRGDISPLQGLSLFKRTNPGRCPGLSYAALSGLKACEFWAGPAPATQRPCFPFFYI